MARKHILPLLKWPGGKYHKARVLAACLPDHDTYVEPFAGGASVFWNKQPAETEVLSDLNDWLIHFYDDARRGALDGCKPIVSNKRNFDALEGRKDACSILMRNRMSYHGSMKSMALRSDYEPEVGGQILRDRAAYERRLRKTNLRIADFEDTMQRYDGPSTVHYLDPPYTALERSAKYSKDQYGGRDQLSVERVAEVASKMQGAVVISYDDSPRARQAFGRAGLFMYKLPCTRSPGSGGTKKDYELVVTNFRLPSKIKLTP